MAETVSNYDLIIATKGTGHMAQAKPATADLCFDLAKKPKVKGDNKIASFHLLTGITTKSYISNDPVWTSKGWLDEIPSWPKHDGVGGGVNVNVGQNGKLNFINFAWATSYSEVVKVEKCGVVRSLDTTKQNGGNCDGFVDDSNLKGKVVAVDAALKEACKVELLTGTCSHGRPLGAPPNAKAASEGFFLDVWSDDTVTLNITQKPLRPGDPKCGKHPYWYAKRSGEWKGDGASKDLIGTTFEVSGGLTVDPIDDPAQANVLGEATDFTITPGMSREDRMAELKRRREERQIQKAIGAKDPRGRQGIIQRMPPAAGSNKSAAGRVKELRQTVSQDASRFGTFYPDGGPRTPEAGAKAAIETITAAKKTAELLSSLYQFWKLEREPPVVNVTIAACGNNKNLKLRVFPNKAIEYEVPLGFIEKYLSIFLELKKSSTWIATNLKIKADFEMLTGWSCVFAIAYKELETDLNGRTKSEVRRAWHLALQSKPLFKISWGGQLSLITIIGNMFSPGVGSGLDTAARALGFTFYGFLTVELSIDLKVAVGVDQYDTWSINGTELVLTGTVDVGIALNYDGIAGYATASSSLIWENTLKLTNFRKPKNIEAWIAFDLQGFMQIGAKASVVADLIGFIKVNEPKTWKPEALRFPKPGQDTITFEPAPSK